MEARRSSRWSMPLSLTIQVAAVSLMFLLPVIHGERLTLAPPSKAAVYLAPIPRGPLPATKATTSHSINPPRRFDEHLIIAPVRIPRSPAIINDETPPIIPGSALLASGAGPATYGIDPTNLLSRNAPPPPEQKRATVVTPAMPHAPVRVTSTVQEAKRIVFVKPSYPELARTIRLSGTVELLGVIATDGTIQSLRVVSGHPILVKAAVDAVRQWRYSPTVLNGQPVEVIAPITVTFTLQQ